MQPLVLPRYFCNVCYQGGYNPLWEFVKKHSTRMKWVPGARYESPLNSDNKQVPKFLGKVQISPILCFVFWIIEDVLRYDVISARYVGCWYLFGITGKRSSIANYWSHSRKGGMLYQLLLTDSIGRVVVTFTTPLVNNFTPPKKNNNLVRQVLIVHSISYYPLKNN